MKSQEGSSDERRSMINRFEDRIEAIVSEKAPKNLAL